MASSERHPAAVAFCDRCARRTPALFFDDVSLQELCQDCSDRLKRRRGAVSQPATPRS